MSVQTAALAEPSERRGTPARYRTDIDGLRAVAVLAVVFYHAFPSGLTGGFVGVDVFFVISGFLISGIVFNDLDRHRFSFLAFYGRRIRRIFPALLLVLLFCLGYGMVVLLPAEFAQLGEDVAAGVGFISNFLLWHEAGYFDRAAVTKPLLHLWSLGVEEQFYIVWPLALWALHRTGLGRPRFLAAVTVVSFCLNLVLSRHDATADFYSPLTRFWELSCGAMLAAVPGRPTVLRQASLRDAASVLGLAFIVGSAVLLDRTMRFPGVLGLLPTCGALLLIAAGGDALVNRQLLSSRAAVLIGLISYPLYLWHWPLISYAYIIRRGREPKPLVAAGLLAASFVLSWLTYRLVEHPVRFGVRSRGVTPWLVALMAAIGAFGVATWRADGFPGRYPRLPHVDVAKINAAVGDGYFKPTRDMRVQDIDRTLVARIGAGEGAVLFTGDSLMFHYGPRMQRLFTQGRLTRTVYFVVGASCAPIPGIAKPGMFAHCSDMPQIAEDVIARDHVGAIVIGAFWPGYSGAGVTVTRADRTRPVVTPEALDDVYANLEDEVSGMIAAGHAVYLVLEGPVSERFDPQKMVDRTLTGFTIAPEVVRPVPMAELTEPAADANRRLRAIAARTGAKTIDLLAQICGDGSGCSPFFGDGEPKFADEKHLRPIFVGDRITAFDFLVTR